jgi:hypothetical protein
MTKEENSIKNSTGKLAAYRDSRFVVFCLPCLYTSVFGGYLCSEDRSFRNPKANCRAHSPFLMLIWCLEPEVMPIEAPTKPKGKSKGAVISDRESEYSKPKGKPKIKLRGDS